MSDEMTYTEQRLLDIMRRKETAENRACGLGSFGCLSMALVLLAGIFLPDLYPLRLVLLVVGLVMWSLAFVVWRRACGHREAVELTKQFTELGGELDLADDALMDILWHNNTLDTALMWVPERGDHQRPTRLFAERIRPGLYQAAGRRHEQERRQREAEENEAATAQRRAERQREAEERRAREEAEARRRREEWQLGAGLPEEVRAAISTAARLGATAEQAHTIASVAHHLVTPSTYDPTQDYVLRKYPELVDSALNQLLHMPCQAAVDCLRAYRSYCELNGVWEMPATSTPEAVFAPLPSPEGLTGAEKAWLRALVGAARSYVPEVLAELTDAHPGVRRAGTQNACMTFDARLIAPLVRILEGDKALGLRGWAAVALGVIRHPDALAALHDALNQVEPEYPDSMVILGRLTPSEGTLRRAIAERKAPKGACFSNSLSKYNQDRAIVKSG